MGDFPTGSLKEFIGFLILLMIISAIFSFGAFGLGEVIWALGDMENGLIIGLMIVLIPLIIIFAFLIRNSNKKSKENKEISILEQKLKEKSISTERKIIKKYVQLSDEKKQLLTKVYNIPYQKDEDILISLLKMWDFTYNLDTVLADINVHNSIDMNYRTLKLFIPEGIAWPIFERDNYICQKCGDIIPKDEPIYEIRHHIYLIKDLSEGGTFAEENLQTVCKHCKYAERVKSGDNL